MKNFEKYTILEPESIRAAIKKMDIEDVHFLAVVNQENRITGVFTLGDFRKAVLSGLDIKEKVDKISNKNFLYLSKGYSKKEACRLFKKDLVHDLPVLHNGELVDIVHRKEFFGVDADNGISDSINLAVVIMAGGKGTRLDPFTKILPKPLIPLGNDPVVKIIMDEFMKYGMVDFYLTLNEKSRMIKAYFHDHDFGYQIRYIEERKPMGTVGALKLLEGQKKKSIFVTNCDIIIKSNYAEILKYHRQGGYALTLVGAMQQYTIPYGVCDIENGGDLKSISEKPEYDFLVNTGLYILEPHVIGLIPDDTFYDMTDLIKRVKDENLQVGVFPVSEQSWVDVGQWEGYAKTVKQLNL